ncbi:MAG: NrsF family protein [Rickettsiales bacterium]|nr:NrsF family protein [Rickettsiales bacterium]
MSHEALIANLVEDATPVVPLNLFRRCFWMVTALTTYILLTVAYFGFRRDWADQMIEGAAYPSEMLITLILAFGAAIAALRLSVPRERKSSLSLLMLILPIAIGAVIWLLGQVSVESFSASIQSPSHFYITLGVLAGAVPVALLLFWLLRQGSPTQLGWAGSMVLLSASAVGHLLMRTIGQADNFADVLVWCYSPILFCGLVGVFIGKKALRW